MAFHHDFNADHNAEGVRCQNALDDCGRHRVDWRARCLAVEAERDAMRQVVEADIELRRAEVNAPDNGWSSSAVRTKRRNLTAAIDAYRKGKP